MNKRQMFTSVLKQFTKTATAVRDKAVEVSDSHHAAPIHAAWRGGLKDLQDAIQPAFPDSLKAREEAGGIASPTPQIVTGQMKEKAGQEMEMG